ncbi:hypothetical protein HZF05_08745 [Sphingomonas sp. CGMCC 1.13654]|uniref:Uncharacterized protein n=2 Tax=Sphingomonas chungangi TaxID=2683589 RepID=A0A838L584_9SPHN|nr:DUF6683 family protein [Sphingomonas chungangi]MBA2934187.1 hypothetical protein [Sphingomonas chungangi]MVW57228.1 hypothetical protein [Sphingomonas chungangi]
MMNVVQLGQPLAFQARNARIRAEEQRGIRAPLPAPRSAPLTFAPGTGVQTVNAYVARVSRQDPTAGGQLRTALAGKNVPAIFGQLVAPFGLGNHDVADAMAAHLIMRTMVVTGAQPPSPQGVRNVRDSIAQALAHDPKMASEAYRSQIGGEAQLDFLLVNTTWRAIGAGKWPADAAAQYRHSVASSLAREGVDLNTTQLTPDGFAPK